MLTASINEPSAATSWKPVCSSKRAPSMRTVTKSLSPTLLACTDAIENGTTSALMVKLDDVPEGDELLAMMTYYVPACAAGMMSYGSASNGTALETSNWPRVGGAPKRT